MTPKEREQMDRLCLRIRYETDHETFSELIQELNERLEAKERRFRKEQKKDPLLRIPTPK